MITKTKTADFNFGKNYPYFPNYNVSLEEEMTSKQRRILTELIYTKISDSGEIEERLMEMENFNYNDAKKAIRDLTESRWQ